MKTYQATYQSTDGKLECKSWLYRKPLVPMRKIIRIAIDYANKKEQVENHGAFTLCDIKRID